MTGKATFKKGSKLSRIERNLDNPVNALKQIGAMMVSESQSAFRDQRFGKTSWPARAQVNVFGIISDFAGGSKKPRARRFEQRPALIDTGGLRSSISFGIVGSHVVEVGTVKPYSSVHQSGGPVESEKLTSTVRTALWKWLKKQSRDMKSQLGWVLNKKFKDKKISGNVPARPFVGVNSQTLKNIHQAIGVKIMEADQ